MVGASTDGIERLRRTSKLLLGNADRLQVSAAIAEAEPDGIYAEAVARLAGVKEPRAGEQLRHLEQAGMLSRHPKVGRLQKYERTESAYWSMCLSLRDEVLTDAASIVA